MDIYEGKCTCSSDCARTLLVEPVYRVIVYDDDDRLSATQTMTRAELLDWLSSDDDCIVEDADNLYSIEPDAAAVHAWLDGTEADDLRRQVEHANRWRDVAIVEANEARAEAADLRRQFEQERVEIGMLRRQLQEGEQSALSHAIGQIFHLRRQLAECQEIAAARGESLGYETADEWNDNPATDANDARQEAAKLRRQLDRERIAAIQHAIWSHWMTYQFSVCLRNDDGTMTIPAQKVMRWERQAATPYAELSEAERESDRHQADRILVADDTPHGAEKGDA